MTNYARELQRRISGEQGQENPLEIIGLSPEILELGLTEEQLYRQCQRFASGLLAAVHPDVHGGAESPAVTRFSEVANRLKDRRAFKMALDEFREINAYERANLRTLRNQVKHLREETIQLEDRISAKEEAFAKESQFREGMYRYLVGQAMRFSPNKNVWPLRGTAKLSAVSISDLSFSPAPSPSRELEAEMNALYTQGIQHAQKEFGPLLGLIRENNLAATPLPELIRQARESGYPLAAIRWSSSIAIHKMGFRRTGTLASKDRGGVIRAVPHDGWAPSSIEGYWGALDILAQTFGGRYAKTVGISPEKSDLDGRFLYEERIKHSLCILGTIDLELGLSRLEGIGEGRLTVGHDVLPEVEPFLARGRAIISMHAPEAFVFQKRGDTWDTLIRRRNDLITQRLKVARLLYLSHIVLDVE